MMPPIVDDKERMAQKLARQTAVLRMLQSYCVAAARVGQQPVITPEHEALIAMALMGADRVELGDSFLAVLYGLVTAVTEPVNGDVVAVVRPYVRQLVELIGSETVVPPG